MKKLLKIALVLFGLGVVGLVFAIENLLPYYGIKPFRMVPEEHSWRFPKGYLPENYGLSGTEISVTCKDGVVLRGWFLPAKTDSARATVVVLHGISSCKETQFERARILADMGFNSFALDLRAHGESGGDYCTFGYYEKYDLQAVADSLSARTGGLPLGIWGASLGGAISLQAMALDRRYAFGVIESTFDEFEKVAIEYGADWLLGLRSQWLVDRVLHKSAAIARFDPWAVKPVEAAAGIDRPILFLHGDADDKIPMAFNRRNFEAVPTPEKQWITVPGGGHSDLWRVAGPQLTLQVEEFLRRFHVQQPKR